MKWFWSGGATAGAWAFTFDHFGWVGVAELGLPILLLTTALVELAYRANEQP